jgi:flagellar hook assembly protein FlgD
VYNVRGELVRTLVSEARPAGRHEAVWDGSDNAGQPVSSGVYIARLVAGQVAMQRKLMLVK